MAESIREVIARMKANQQTSQVPKPTPAPFVAKPQQVNVVKEAEDEEELGEDAEELGLKPAKVNEKPIESSQESVPKQINEHALNQQIAMDIELLQNNGRFRVELLAQLQEINKALVVIASTIVDIAGKNGQN